MWNNIRNTPPFPSNLELTRIAGLTAYTSIVNSSLGRGVRSQAESVVQQKDGAGRVTKKTYNFPNGAKIEDLLFYPSDPAGLVTFEIRGAYTDLNGMPLITGGGYDAGFDGRYGSVRSIAYRRKANQAPIEVIATNVDGTVFIDTYTYVDADDIEPDRIDQGAPIIPTIGYNLALSASTGVVGTPITLTYNFPAVHAACQLVPTVYGGTGTFAPATINVAANAPQATLTFTPTSNGVLAIGTANNAGFRDPAYQAYVIGSSSDSATPPTTDNTTPWAGLKLREKAIRAATTLDSLRRPISILYTFADNSTILDRYRYATSTDIDPAEILFNTTPTASFPGNVPLTPSGTPPTYGLKLRELAVRASSSLDGQGRAISSIYYFGDGSTILDRYRYASNTDIDPTESLYDTTTSATFLNTPVTPPTSPPVLGSRVREQAAGSYSTLDAQGRAIGTVYYYNDFVRVFDRSRYATTTDLDPTEILYNTTASAGFPSGAVTEVLAPLDTKIREQASRVYSILDNGRAVSTYYAFASGSAVLDRNRYAASDDSFPIEMMLNTTTSAAFPGNGTEPPVQVTTSASSYTISVSTFFKDRPSVLTFIAINGNFPAGTIITPTIVGVAGSMSPLTVAANGGSATATFTPSAAGSATLSATNNRFLPNPSPLNVLVQQDLSWTATGGATANQDTLTLQNVPNSGGYILWPSSLSEVRFLQTSSMEQSDILWAIGDSTSTDNLSDNYLLNIVTARFSGNTIAARQVFSDSNSTYITSGNGVVESFPSGSIISLLKSGNELICRYSNDEQTWTEIFTTTNNLMFSGTRYLKVSKGSDTNSSGVPGSGSSPTITTKFL